MTDDWKTRLTQTLEPVLMQPDPRPQLSAYHDLPYALFQYPPDQEFPLRQELALLRTRLEQASKRITTVDSWRQSAMKRADLTPGLLAERALALMARRRPGQTLVFVVDEVGQYVARDVQKMLDLMGVVQSLGRVGRGKLWLVVTSQEKLTELVGGLDDQRVELARLMDRFPLQIHLEPSDISTVTSQRVLSKNAAAEPLLRELFTTHRGRLSDHTRLSADFRLPELTADAFRDLYPLLPYHIDLIIQIVSGLRTQGATAPSSSWRSNC